MVIGLKSLTKNLLNKELEELDFLMHLDEASNLIDLGLDMERGIAVIETTQSYKRGKNINIKFEKQLDHKIKVIEIYES